MRSSVDPYGRRLEKAAPFFAAAAPFFAFLPALQAGFIDLDDDWSIVLNPHIRGFTLANLRWMFSPSAHQNFAPLTWLSYAATFALAGLDPFAFHLCSLGLHSLSAALFFLISRRLLGGGTAPALFASLFFALHPLRAETAVWASNRLDALAGVFYLGTILLYLRGRRRLALAAYLASLLSKDFGMTLPAALLIIDFHFLRRRAKDPGVWLEKIPFALLALAGASMSLYCHWQSGILWSIARLPPEARAAQAFYGLAFYVRKTLFPFPILPIYAMPGRLSLLDAPFFASAAAVLGAAGWAARRPPWAWAAAFYAITLSPMLGIVKSGPQLVAARYSYIACLGWALLAGSWFGRARRRWAAGAAAAAVLAAASWRLAGVWHDSETLWSWTAERDPAHFVARNYLGNIRVSQGRLREAAALYREALTINPSYASAANNLGNVLARESRLEEAAAAYRAAIALSPGHPVVHRNLALVLAAQKRPSEAAAEYREELRLNPADGEAARALEELERPPAGLRSLARPTTSSDLDVAPVSRARGR